MRLSLRKKDTKKDRRIKIHSAYTELGSELYIICNTSQKIDKSLKKLLTYEICSEYCRQSITPMLESFAAGDFTFEATEEQAIELAKVIKSLGCKEYDELLDQIYELEKEYESSVNSL